MRTHYVIGPSNLDDPEIMSLLNDAYQSGKTVAIANAHQAAADAFRQRASSATANCEDEGDGIALYGLQRIITRRPQIVSNAYQALRFSG